MALVRDWGTTFLLETFRRVIKNTKTRCWKFEKKRKNVFSNSAYTPCCCGEFLRLQPTTCLEEFSLQLLSACLVEFLAFDEALGHPLEVLLRDRSVLVEVDALEVGLHLAHPKVGHGCSAAAADGRR